MLIDYKVKFIIHCKNTLHMKFRMTEPNYWLWYEEVYMQFYKNVLTDNDTDEIILRKNIERRKNFIILLNCMSYFPCKIYKFTSYMII